MLHALATADWHLGGMGSVFSNPLLHQMKEIHKPYRYAAENGIEHVFVPGDISDTESLTEEAMTQLIILLLQYKNIKTYYIPGNHDTAARGVTSLNFLNFLIENGLFSNFKIFFKPEVLKLDGVYVCMMPWPEEEVPKCRTAPLVFAHVEQPGALGDNGRELRTKEQPLKRQAGDYIISGHIHLHQILSKKRFTYVGTLYQKNFGESLPKGFLEFHAKAAQELKVRPEFINSRPDFVLETVIVKSDDDLQALKKDQSIRYKLVVDKASSVVLPKDLTLQYPNIVSVLGSGGLSNVASEELKDQVTDVPVFGPLTKLKTYLRSMDLDKQTRTLAYGLARDFAKEAGLI